MANIDLGNLTRYDGKIKQYVEDKYLSKNTANWQMTEKAGAVTCYPVPDTELEPIVDFSFKEVPPAEGEKSPDNPSTIQGTENIVITKCGKNLLPSTPAYIVGRGITVSFNADGSMHLSGTSYETAFPYIYYFTSDINIIHPALVLGKPITISLKSTETRMRAELIYTTSKVTWDYAPNITAFVNESNTIILPSDINSVMVRLRVDRNITVDCDVYLQIEYGLEATEWESPIDISTNVNLNNTYYGGNVNISTGMMAITWGGEYINSFIAIDNNLIQENTVCLAASVSFRHLGNVVPQDKFTTDKFIPQAGSSDIEHMRQSGGTLLGAFGLNFYINKTRLDLSNATDPSNPTNEEWLIAGNAWLANNPIFYVGKLFNPYIIQLTPQQIKSFFILDKNTPRLNTLYTDADSIQVGYQKHPARTAYELENAILALGGGE